MDKQLKRKWLKALRSGKYEQGQGLLRTVDNKFCCLGVLCDVQGRRWYGGPKAGEYAIGRNYDATGEMNRQLERVVDGREHLKRLIRMNDDGKTFADIANYIAANL